MVHWFSRWFYSSSMIMLLSVGMVAQTRHGIAEILGTSVQGLKSENDRGQIYPESCDLVFPNFALR